MSKAAANGRSVAGQNGANWVMKNLAPSQLRTTEVNSQLVSGYFGGGDNLGSGRPPSMYPDNRTTFKGGDVVSSTNGLEEIRDSRTASLLG